MDYVAIDVETANSDCSSICQIGIVEFKQGRIHKTWSSLVDPEAYFDSFNISIHGIAEKDVQGFPTFDKIYHEIKSWIEGNITVHHMPFDRTAINRVCSQYDLSPIAAKWLDSAKIVRRTWDEFSSKGYGLANVASHLNIDFHHHDALEDAKTAGEIVRIACEKSGLSIEESYERIGLPFYAYSGGSSTVKLEANEAGSLYGENLVFTGELSLPRREIAEFAAKIGCNVKDSVTKKTTILVVGIQTESKLAGYSKSSKHRKAEEMIQLGCPLKILSEKDFVEILKQEEEVVPIEKPIESTTQIRQTTEESSVKGKGLIIELDDETSKAWNELKVKFKEVSHDQKRSFSSKLISSLTNIKELAEKHKIEELENEKVIDMLSSIAFEMDQFQDVVYELMRNKGTLSDCYEQLEWAMVSIEQDYEEIIQSGAVDKFFEKYMTELQNITEEMNAILLHYSLPKSNTTE